MVDNIRTASNRISLERVSWLPDVLFLFLPDEEQRHALEGIDEGEEEVLNEELMMERVNIVKRGHKVDKDLAEFILTRCADAGSLEKSNEKLHYLWGVFLQKSLLTFE